MIVGPAALNAFGGNIGDRAQLKLFALARGLQHDFAQFLLAPARLARPQPSTAAADISCGRCFHLSRDDIGNLAQGQVVPYQHAFATLIRIIGFASPWIETRVTPSRNSTVCRSSAKRASWSISTGP